ncbi:MAG: hypothetical protein AB4352_25830 [Hormoscilla sp.]
MKTRTKIASAIGIAVASLFYYATPGSALTWNFTYQSDRNQYNFPAGYGPQSGSFVAPGSEVDGGPYPITEFQFSHNGLPYNFTSANSTIVNTVGATNTVTITGGTVSAIDLFFNDRTISGSFEISSDFDQVTLYNTTNGTFDDDIDGSNSTTDITFTRATGAGAPWEFSPGPALVIMTVGLGINKLVKKWRVRHKDKQE